MWHSGKESACQYRRLYFHPGSGRSPREGNGNPLQYSCLGNPSDRGAWRAIVHVVVRKHLTGGFLCAVLDLSGILCSLLIPEYSGIKRRGKPLPGLRNQAFPSLVFLYSDKYPLPFYEPYGKSDYLQLSLSLIWITYVL